MASDIAFADQVAHPSGPGGKEGRGTQNLPTSDGHSSSSQENGKYMDMSGVTPLDSSTPDKTRSLLRKKDPNSPIKNRSLRYSRQGSMNIRKTLAIMSGTDMLIPDDVSSNRPDTSLDLSGVDYSILSPTSGQGNVALTPMKGKGEQLDAMPHDPAVVWFHTVSEGKPEDVAELISQGMNLNIRNQDGWAALHVAIIENNTDVLHVLLERGADVDCAGGGGETPLLLAVLLKQTDVMNALLERKARADFACTGKMQVGLTPLHIAAQGGDPDVTRVLLKHGASTEVGRANLGITPLHDAAKYGNDCVSVLLEAKADILAESKGGLMALHVAALNGRADTVRKLLEAGADPWSKATVGSKTEVTPLHLAVTHKYADVVAAFAEICTDFHRHVNDVQIDKGVVEEASLHIASKEGAIDIARILLDNKAKVNIKDTNNFTPLHHACALGHADLVAVLLQAKGCNVNALAKSRKFQAITPLHLAVQNGHLAIVQLLKAAECDLNAAEEIAFGSPNDDGRGNTALHMACEMGNLTLVRMLVEAGADVNLTAAYVNQNTDVTALHIACQNGHLEIAEVLLDASAKLTSLMATADDRAITPLHQAAFHDHTDLVTLLADQGADLHAATTKGITCLHYACQNGNSKLAKMLTTTQGCNINKPARYKDHNHVTPLHLAAQNGHLACVQVLLEGDASINAKKSMNGIYHGVTPLHQACSNQHVETVRQLLDFGAHVNALVTVETETNKQQRKSKRLSDIAFDSVSRLKGAVVTAAGNVSKRLSKSDTPPPAPKEEESVKEEKPKGGYTALHWGVEQGNLQIAELLLEKGVNVNAKAGLGPHSDVTALHIAAILENSDVAKALIKHGADINMERAHGERKGILPLHVAAEFGNTETVIELVEEGAAIDAKDSLGFTPLLLAVKYGHLAVAKVLLDHDCSLTIATHSGRTPESLAKKLGNPEMIELLSKARKARPPLSRASSLARSFSHIEVPRPNINLPSLDMSDLLCGFRKKREEACLEIVNTDDMNINGQSLPPKPPAERDAGNATTEQRRTSGDDHGANVTTSTLPGEDGEKRAVKASPPQLPKLTGRGTEEHDQQPLLTNSGADIEITNNNPLPEGTIVKARKGGVTTTLAPMANTEESL